MRVYRLQTDAGERIIGRLVSPAWVAQASENEVPTLSPADAFAAVLEGRTLVQLADGLELRRVRVMGEVRIELSGFTEGMVERLKAMGLMSEIIAWKLRLFVPTGSSGPAILATVMERYPLVRVADRARREPMSPAADLAHRLARDAEAVCRYYLPHGRREGRYWLVGDVADTPGRSLFVRLHGPDHGKGAAGRWQDAASGEYGDLLDLIALNRRLDRFRDVLAEARAFLSLPRPEPVSSPRPPVPCGSPEAARRLFAMARPLSGTLAEAYLRGRGITALPGTGALRFHPGCYYRPHDDAPVETWPALIAAVTDLAGTMTGAHRTWLDPVRQRQSPYRHAAAGDGPPARQRGPLRCRRMTSWRRAKASKPCCRCGPSSLPCPWWRRCPPIILPPSCFRRRCGASTSRATAMPPATSRWPGWPDAHGRPGSSRSHYRRRMATSMTTCGASAAIACGQPCSRSSPRTT